MATGLLSTPSTATVAGLFVASLGAVYAYTHLATLKDKDTMDRVHTRAGADARNDDEAKRSSETTPRKGKKRKKGKSWDDSEDRGTARGRDGDKRGTPVVPGDFEAADATAVGPLGVSLVRAVSRCGSRTGKRNKKKNQGMVQDREAGAMNSSREEAEQGEPQGSETGKERGARRAPVHGPPRSSDSTDADALSPSVSASTPASSGVTANGNVRASTRRALPPQPRVQTRAHALSQPCAILPSLSFDTDSSWTHVDRRHLKVSKSVNGQSKRLADAMDITSSDLASTESNSPVAECAEQLSLAERLVPRSEETGVGDMLEQPDFPASARVMRVQPRADETPVPGFSWDDYGVVLEDSLVVHDADQEDEGEWGIVKRPLQTTTSASTSHAAAAPETMTKRQRQNARKRKLAKSGRAAAEAMRLEGLAKHKRELERLRIIEQSRQGGRKQAGGGMQATVDDQGKLVWE